MTTPSDLTLASHEAEHECRESQTCTCYQLALEPDESCPQHGAGEWPPRCEVCGRFIKRKENYHANSN